jgi:hypothetical protein
VWTTVCLWRFIVNHYQKIATVLVRGAGITALALGLLGLLYGAVLQARGVSLTVEQAERFGSSVWYVMFGLILFVLGRPLGRLLGRELD